MPIYLYKPKEDLCRFNSYVECKDRDRCIKCGWNPMVEEERKKEQKEGENN